MAAPILDSSLPPDNALERQRAADEAQRLTADLQEQSARLKELDGELESFSYSVSHDLRAPLRHISGYAELLSREAGPGLDENCRRYVEIISESAKKMGSQIDGLLTLSRLGRAEFRGERVDLNALVAAVVSNLSADAPDRKIVWKNGRLPAVFGDATMLRQMFVNLLSNAIKFTGPRDPAVIETGCTTDADGGVVVFVRDNGVGFKMEYAGKLFGVFQRLHPEEQFEGTGIGLASVRRIIQRHGGRAWAEGKLDTGATFYFSLPNRGQEADAPAQTQSPG